MRGLYLGPHGSQFNEHAEDANGGLHGNFPLGHGLVLPDGRKYALALNDGTVEVAGNLYQAAAPVANHLNCTVVSGAAGSKVLVATLGATLATVDQYREGTVHVNDQAGEGHIYGVEEAHEENDAHDNVASGGNITINLVDGIQVALTTSSQVTFCPNRFTDVLINPSPSTSELAGVAPHAATASYYYWSQVQGRAAVFVAGTVLIGDLVVPAATTSGCIMPSAAFETDGPMVGICVAANATTEYAAINLHLPTTR